ncbi:MAG: hypothetical protein NTV63_01850 [Candidatus Woesearchaeota archaeon]|nr:hypothetical protein [Candidatus Woesearchaeota archaeon]
MEKIQHYKKKTLKLLLFLLLLFAAIFFLSLRNIYLGRESSFFALGIPGENAIVLIFSVAAIVKTVFDIYGVESDGEHQARL